MKFTFLLTLFCSVASALGQDNTPAAVALHFAPAPGDHLLLVSTDYSVDTDPPADAPPPPNADPLEQLKASLAPKKVSETRGEVGLDWKIEEPDADGNTVITVSYAYVRREITKNKQVRPSLSNFTGEEVVDPGQMVVVDSRQTIVASNPTLPPDWETSPVIKASVEAFEWLRGMLNDTLIGRPFTVAVSPRGKVVAVKGMDVIWDNFRERMKEKTAQADRPRLDNFIEAFFGEDNVTKTFTLNLLVPFPEQSVRPQERWFDEYEFELAGLKLPITRRLELDEAPAADGTASLSGLYEYHFPKRKDAMVIDAKKQYLSITTNINVATGMYQWLNYTGALEITGRESDAAENARPTFYLNSQLSGSVKVRRLSWRDPADQRFSVYPGAEGAYQVHLGRDWAPNIIDEKLNDSLISTYKHARSEVQLTATVQPISLTFQWDHPLNEMAARLKQSMEADGSSQVKISWNKLFDAGPMHWARFRMEITSRDGTQRTNWAQLGYATSGQYAFELTHPGLAVSDVDAEVDAILNSIATKEPTNP
jgi:hypothetical protein